MSRRAPFAAAFGPADGSQRLPVCLDRYGLSWQAPLRLIRCAEGWQAPWRISGEARQVPGRAGWRAAGLRLVHWEAFVDLTGPSGPAWRR